MNGKHILIGAWLCVSLALWSGCSGELREFNEGGGGSSGSDGGSDTCVFGQDTFGDCTFGH